MSKKQETKNVLSQLLSNIDEIALKKTSNRMMVAAKISNALKNKGISQKEFAKMLRKSESEISSWLSGDRNFTIDTLTEVSEALDISLLDTEAQTTCTFSVHTLLPGKRQEASVGISARSNWACNLGYIDCRKGQKVG